jgi:pyruvate/2-oxoglutarate/acetoin dehydrogenase E1 component
MIVSIWDDEYGISVHAKHQTTKEDLSEILSGFQRNADKKGFELVRVKGWDYPELVEAYQRAGQLSRTEHVPVIIHVTEVTQPQGHSTSGSHERYKSKERLEWETQHDCNLKMREWMIESNLASEEELTELEKSIKKEVREGKKRAWAAFIEPQKKEQQEALTLLANLAESSHNGVFINKLRDTLSSEPEPLRRDILSCVRKALRFVAAEDTAEKRQLQDWIDNYFELVQPKYSDQLYSESPNKATSIPPLKPTYETEAPEVDARIVLRDNFDKILGSNPQTLIFGEDSGTIGDVNQGLEGLQDKYGELRVSDTGIREATILGQGIGMAMRGLRPIAEIQYLDYVLYCLQIMSDDLATVRYRTKGMQKAPVIVRTRGHRLEGIWHSGSHMGALVHLLRGMYILVPRDMTTAAGFYNTLLQSDEPALIVECLNGYRLKEKLPNNLGEFRTPIGVVETLKEGSDITLVSYGSTLRVVQEAANQLLQLGIDAEVIDIQTLLPLDINQDIANSVEKTNRLMVIDEDVPGGASAYILQQLLDEQKVYRFLDSPPQTLTAQAHRPAYGTDGDYFSKPSTEDVFEAVYAIIHEARPEDFPRLR